MKNKIFSILLTLIFLCSTLPAALAAGTYPYSLDALHFTDLSGNVLENPTGSCMASVRMAKTDPSRTAVDSLILSAYSTTGELLAFNVMQSYLNPYEYRTFSSLINVPKGELLGEVRAFVWDSVNDMTPLAETVSVTVNAQEPEPAPYTASGYITDTWQCNPSLPRGTVIFHITSSDDFDGQVITTPQDIRCTVNDDFTAYPNLPMTAALRKNEDGTYAFAACDYEGALQSFKTAAIDDYSFSNNRYLNIYTTPAQTETFRLANSTALYLNTAHMDELTEQSLKEYLQGSTDAFSLADYDNDGLYDAVYADFYATVAVDAVNSTTNKIYFSKILVGKNASITLDELHDARIYKNGSEITIGDLKPQDILTIYYDISADWGVQSSHYYTIYVSDSTAEGKYIAYNPKTETITLKETEEYTFTTGLYFQNEYVQLVLGDTYKLYLDAFGRIFSCEKNASSVNYAVFDKYTKSSADDFFKATLFTKDGHIDAYQVDTNHMSIDGYSGFDLNRYLLLKLYRDLNSNGQIDESEKANSNKNPIEKRIITYKLNSKGIITDLTFLDGRSSGLAAYKEQSHSVGSIKMGDATKIINAIDYVDEDNQTSYLSTASLSDFVDAVDYCVFGFGDKLADNTYPFVVIVCGEGLYTESTHFAVVEYMPLKRYQDSNLIYSIDVIYAGTSQTLLTTDAAILDCYGLNGVYMDAEDLQKGDVIVFQGDVDNVKQIDMLFRGSRYIGNYETNTIANLLVAGNNSDKIGIPVGVGTFLQQGSELKKWTTNWVSASFSEQKVQLVMGPVIEKKNGYFSIAQIADDNGKLYTDIDHDERAADGIMAIDISADTKVTVYDYCNSEKARLQEGTTRDIMNSTISYSIYEGPNRNIIPWDTVVAEGMSINFAFAKVVDGEATDVFVINAA